MLRMPSHTVSAMAIFLATANDTPQAQPPPRRRPPTIRELAADDLTVCLPSNADWVHRTLNSMTDAELADLPAATIDLKRFARELELN